MTDIDKGRWVLVPAEPTPDMWDAAENASMACELSLDRPGYMDDDMRAFPTARIWMLVCAYRAMVAVAPEAPNDSITAEEARTFQRWAGMDGATAWHLIDRHANGWGDVGRMMDAWLEANRGKSAKEQS